MIIMETLIKIHRLHHKQGLSIRAIARQLNLDRRTVTKYLKHDLITTPQYKRSHQHYPALGQYLDTLNQALQQQIRLPAKERLTARQHYEQLQTLGYQGSYSAVCRFVSQFYQQQPSHSDKAFIPLSFDIGDAYQFDWSTETVKIAGQLCKVQCAHFRLSHSRAFFLRCYLKQSTEMFIDAHNHAFAFFGGTLQRGIYDNLKTAVNKILPGKERIFNETFHAMMTHFNIEPVACTPASGWEKGQVERQVSIHRQRFFKPMLSFHTLDELNQYLMEQCLSQMSKLKHPQFKSQTIAQVFEQEKQHLQQPVQAFTYYRVTHLMVNSYCLVHFEGNRYSVPCEFSGKTVTLHAYMDRIEIIYEHQMIAQHQRIWQKQQTAYNPWHYLPLLKRKPGALRNGEPFKAWVLPPAVKQLQQHLMKQPKGDRTMVEILALIAEYGEDVGVTAAELALEAGIPTVAAVQNIINRLNEPTIPKYTTVTEVTLTIPPSSDLSRYNTLLKQSYDTTVQYLI